jgi:hypothetical protein
MSKFDLYMTFQEVYKLYRQQGKDVREFFTEEDYTAYFIEMWNDGLMVGTEKQIRYLAANIWAKMLPLEPPVDPEKVKQKQEEFKTRWP